MRRLTDSGPDTIEWWPEVTKYDEYGTPVHVPGPTSITFRAHAQRVTAEERVELGQSLEDVWAFQTSRELRGAHSGLEVNGRPATVTQPPQPQGRTKRTFTTRIYFMYLDEVGETAP